MPAEAPMAFAYEIPEMTEKRRLWWNDQASKIFRELQVYEDEHPTESVCLRDVLEAVDKALSKIPFKDREEYRGRHRRDI